MKSIRSLPWRPRRVPLAALVAALIALPVAAQTERAGFVPNRGQWPAKALFQYRQGPATAWFHDDGMTLALTRYRDRTAGEPGGSGLAAAPEPVASVALRWRLLGTTGAAPIGEDTLPGRQNYLLGNDPGCWATHVPAFRRIVQEDVYPGIDVVWHRRDGRLTYDLRVAPGADPSAAVVRIEGAQALRVDADGRLIAPTPLGEVAFTPPVSWEVTASGRRPVTSRFALVDAQRYRIEVDRIDERLPLVVDPGLEWSTFFDNLSETDIMAVREDGGLVYIVGQVQLPGLPTTPGVVQTSFGGIRDIFVSCLDPRQTGNAQLVWSTYLGDTDVEIGYDLHVAPGGDPVTIVGITQSANFPVTGNAFQGTIGGGYDAVIAQLSGGGTTLAYSTFLGGSGHDRALTLDSGATGVFTIAGYTGSINFPTTPGTWQTTSGGGDDAFVVQLDLKLAGLSQLVTSTYLGGSAAEGKFNPTGNIYNWDGLDVFVDANGTVTVAGMTLSANFPTTAGALDRTYGGGVNGFGDIFVSQLGPALATLPYSTFVGAGSNEGAIRVVVDRSGDIVFTGWTWSRAFPTTSGAYNRTFGGTNDGVIAKINPGGNGSQDLRYSTLISGPSYDVLWGLAVESSGIIVAGGGTGGGLQPTPGAWQTQFLGVSMGVLLRLDPAGQGAADMHYLSYLGAGGVQTGFLSETVSDLVQRPDGRVVCAGYTENPQFRTTSGALQTSFGGPTWDSFVAHLDLLPSNVTRVGPSTPACLGYLDLQVNQMPAPGATSFQLICNDAPPQAPGALWIGAASAPFTVFNIQVLTVPLLSVPLTAGSGFATTPLPLPGSLTFPLGLAFQYVWLTTPTCQGSGPFAASDALQF